MFFTSPWTRKPHFPKGGRLNYDAYWQQRGWSVATHLKPRENVIMSLVPKTARVFDIGCGNSRLPVALKEAGAEVVVADLSPMVLEGYRQFGITGQLLDLEKIFDFKPVVATGQKYDYVILSEVLEHVTNPEEVLEHLAPLTERFIITIPNSAAYGFRFSLMLRGRFFTQWVMHPSEHLRFWSHLDFVDWLAAQGLKLERVEVTDGFTLRGLLPALPRWWKNFLAFRMVYVVKSSSGST